MLDLISGSWPGELSLFKRNSDGSFSSAETIQNEKGEPLDLGRGTSPFIYDWNHDGLSDLIVGNTDGVVYFVPRIAGKERKFGSPEKLTLADGKALEVNGSASPVVADWDGDGKPDLIVGAYDGSVMWFRNIGTKKEPKLETGKELVPKCPTPFGYDPKPGEWGTRVKPAVFDWDGDGRLDLLVGDMNGYFQGKPTQTGDEKEEEKEAHSQLPKLRTEWAEALKKYRASRIAPPNETLQQKELREAEMKRFQTQIQRFKNGIDALEEVQSKFGDRSQSHGYVWLFKRNPIEGKK
jgi:hypothetical protein